jgi:hypothetical protein
VEIEFGSKRAGKPPLDNVRCFALRRRGFDRNGPQERVGTNFPIDAERAAERHPGRSHAERRNEEIVFGSRCADMRRLDIVDGVSSALAAAMNSTALVLFPGDLRPTLFISVLML